MLDVHRNHEFYSGREEEEEEEEEEEGEEEEADVSLFLWVETRQVSTVTGASLCTADQ